MSAGDGAQQDTQARAGAERALAGARRGSAHAHMSATRAGELFFLAVFEWGGVSRDSICHDVESTHESPLGATFSFSQRPTRTASLLEDYFKSSSWPSLRLECCLAT